MAIHSFEETYDVWKHLNTYIFARISSTKPKLFQAPLKQVPDSLIWGFAAFLWHDTKDFGL